MKQNIKYLLLIFLISFILFSPSLFTFFTNDDFFLLKISQAGNLKEFLNFFNLTRGPDGLGMYRPLTTQVFYFLGWKLFNLDPLGLHIISFGVFFAVVYLVYRITYVLLSNFESRITNNVSLLAAFLYSVSATHFGHLYYLAAFQELGLTVFFLLSVLTFINFLEKSAKVQLFISVLFFILSLLSKETAVVLPLVLVLVYWFFRAQKRTDLSIRKFIGSTVPFFLILSSYFIIRVFFYGITSGDSYIWDFSPRVLNTIFWYGLWSFGLPEMLVDFVGPGLKFNPNLLKFWSREIIPIFILFGTILAQIGYLMIKNYKKLINRKSLILILFCISWFIVTLSPVLFLPLHKFTYYLTVPLVGISVAVSYLLATIHSSPITILFLAIWLSLSILTLTLTHKSHWITRGATVAKNVHKYFEENELTLTTYRTIAFYNTQEDSDLPWKPSSLLKVVLSDQNYFKVFWNDKYTAKYYDLLEVIAEKDAIKIKARKFLGY